MENKRKSLLEWLTLERRTHIMKKKMFVILVSLLLAAVCCVGCSLKKQISSINDNNLSMSIITNDDDASIVDRTEGTSEYGDLIQP